MELGAELGWFAALQASQLSTAIKGSSTFYPALNTLHVLGIGLVLGSLTGLDLRLLGFAKDIPATAAERFLRGIAIGGLVVAMPTGLLLFITEAATLPQNAIFLTKLVLLCTALGNAALFAWLWRDRIAQWDVQPPVFGQAQAVLSLCLWVCTAAAGRLIAYY